MARLANLDFEALTPTGSNYLNWKVDATLALRSQNLYETLEKPNNQPADANARALMLLKKHIHLVLKNEYLTVDCPAELWQQLADRFHHLRLITLPATKQAWRNVRFQDYKMVAEYNVALLSITSRLAICNEPEEDLSKIDKTLSTFHVDNVLLQQQYRGFKFTKYNELMQVLHMAEEQNNLLTQNHLSRPTGAAPLPEVNHNIFGN